MTTLAAILVVTAAVGALTQGVAVTDADKQLERARLKEVAKATSAAHWRSG